MHRFLHAAIAPLVVLAASTAAKALDLSDHPLLKTDKGLSFRAWLPKDFATRRGNVPLILFSHGFGGCAQQSHSLTLALAEAGYAVLAPDHRDQACDRYLGDMSAILSAPGLHPDQPFTQPAAWDEDTERNRRDDMLALLDFALSHAPYKDAIDPDRIAAMGHSLGGYTALGLGGGWDSWRDRRFKCVLALSPYAAPYLVSRRLGHVSVPVMYQTGTKDIGIEPVLVKQGGYQMTGSPGHGSRKYLLDLKSAGHFAWTELNRSYLDTIAPYAIAFFDRELMGKPAPLLDEKPGPKVAIYRRD
jgi:predicted dienelactone hydrolase